LGSGELTCLERPVVSEPVLSGVEGVEPLVAKGNLEKGMREQAHLLGAIRLHKHPRAQNAIKPL